jgi:hypothetical protein
MEALGRLLNVQQAMDNVYVNVRDAGGITFACYLGGAAGDTYTLTEATTAAGGGAQVLATVTRYHTNTGNGTDGWTLRTQAAASTVITAAAATQNQAVFEVNASELSDGYDFVKVASTGAGVVSAIPRDLRVQRAPANLPAIGV